VVNSLHCSYSGHSELSEVRRSSSLHTGLINL